MPKQKLIILNKIVSVGSVVAEIKMLIGANPANLHRLNARVVITEWEI